MPTLPCLICHLPVTAYAPGAVDATVYECPNCGTYQASGTLKAIFQGARREHEGRLAPPQEALIPFLAAATRRAPEPLKLIAGEWEDVARAEQGRPLNWKITKFLHVVAGKTTVPGEWIVLDPVNTNPLIGLRDVTEFDFIQRHLAQAGYLEWKVEGVPGTETNQNMVRLTVRGWEAANPVVGGVPGTCFVAMSFNAVLNDAYDHGILPAVETDCGFHVVRVDRIHHNESITDKIIAGIRAAQFVVADFTLQRQGVYYEAGFALGLGRTVVWCCREDDKDNLHFDTRQFNHIMWTSPDDLRAKLANRLRATIPGARPGI